MRDTQAEWLETHPKPSLLLPKKFPTTRRECFKIPFSALEKTDLLVSSEYRAALLGVKHQPLLHCSALRVSLSVR